MPPCSPILLSPFPLSPLLSPLAPPPDHRPRRRLPRAAVEHRSGRGHAGVGWAHGRAPRSDLPSFAPAAAKRLERGSAADEPPRDGRGVRRALPHDSSGARSAGADDRCHRRVSGRDGSGFRGHVWGGGGSGVRQSTCLPVQSAARDARRRDERPKFPAGLPFAARRNWEGWVNRCGRGIFENFLAGLCRFWSRARFLVGRAGWAALLTFMPRWLCPAGRSCSVSSPTLSVSRLKTAGFSAGRVVTTDLFAA